jgi:predicted RNA-binding protein YlxR (DUF448 family)
MQASVVTAPQRHGPERQCLACRKRAARDTLVRLVLSPGGEVIADLGHRLPGRGAHCCVTPACLTAAIRRPTLSRAFRTAVAAPDPASWLGDLAAQAQRDLLDLLGLYAKGGVAIAGAERLKARLASDPSPSGMLWLACDAGTTTAGYWQAWADEHNVKICRGLDKERLAKALGMARCSVVWLDRPKAAQRVAWLLQVIDAAAPPPRHE